MTRNLLDVVRRYGVLFLPLALSLIQLASAPMAKARKKSSEFTFETLSKSEADERRRRRGTRRSKYSPIGEQFQSLKKDEVLAFQASKNEVQGVRNYMRRNHEDAHQVNSRRIDGDMFEVHISKA